MAAVDAAGLITAVGSGTAQISVVTSSGKYKKTCSVTVPDRHEWDTDYTVDTTATTSRTGSKSIHCMLCNTSKPGTSVAIPKISNSVLGYTKTQTFMKIILPQVIKIIMPSITNEVITLVKDTSLAFTLAYQEVFSLAKQISASQTSFMPFLIAGVFYFIANYVVERVMARIEGSMDYYK